MERRVAPDPGAVIRAGKCRLSCCRGTIDSARADQAPRMPCSGSPRGDAGCRTRSAMLARHARYPSTRPLGRATRKNPAVTPCRAGTGTLQAVPLDPRGLGRHGARSRMIPVAGMPCRRCVSRCLRVNFQACPRGSQGPQESNPHFARFGGGPPIRWLIPMCCCFRVRLMVRGLRVPAGRSRPRGADEK